VLHSCNVPDVFLVVFSRAFLPWHLSRYVSKCGFEAKGLRRGGSRINGDRFPKQWAPKAQAPRGVRGHVPQEMFWILTPLDPLSWVSESFWKIWLISVKLWKPVWICAWVCHTICSFFFHFLRKRKQRCYHIEKKADSSALPSYHTQ